MNRLLVITVTYNGAAWIERCLGSLLESSLRPDVFLVDNNSTDGTFARLRCFKEDHPDLGLTLVRADSNLGFAAANNQGFAHALERGYDYVYLLNQDAWVLPDTLSTLVAAADAAKGFGVLSPLQMNARLDALDANFARFNHQIPSYLSVAESQFFPAAHWLIPLWALKTVGAFSPVFTHYGEDDNWVDRLHYHGLKAGVVPAARGVHDRAGRKTPRAQRIARKCLSPVIKLSNPAAAGYWWRFLAPLWCVGCACKNFSLIPLRSLPGLLRRYGEISAARRASKSKGAFSGKF